MRRNQPQLEDGASVVKGGSWAADSDFVRSAYRYSLNPEVRDADEVAE